jgi:hypothetical protein
MRMSTAYFAGAGTVAVAVAVGLGGGLLMANIMNPKASAPAVTKLERKSPDAPPAQSAAPNSYLAATQGAATTPVVVQPAAARSADKAAEQPRPATEADNKSQPATDNKPQTTADNKPQPQPSPAAAATPVQQTNAPEAAYAKASDGDLKSSDAKLRDADSSSKRADRERRRADRHQRWVDRHRNQRQREPDTREPDMRDVVQAVREDSSRRDSAPRDYRDAPPREVYRDAPRREYVAEPAGPAIPRFNLFDDNGD